MARSRQSPTRHSVQNHTQAAARVDKGTDQNGSPIERQHVAVWSAPLPPPEILNGYNQVRPGLAEDIIQEFRSESAHRRKLEQDQAALVRREISFGFGASLIYSVALMGVAAYAIHQNLQIVSGIIGAGGIVNGVAAFRKIASADQPHSASQNKKVRKKA